MVVVGGMLSTQSVAKKQQNKPLTAYNLIAMIASH